VILVDYLAVREAVADAAVEVDAFGEGRAERTCDLLRHPRIYVSPARHELDPELVLVRAIDVPADDSRRHEPPTLGRAPTIRIQIFHDRN